MGITCLHVADETRKSKPGRGENGSVVNGTIFGKRSVACDNFLTLHFLRTHQRIVDKTRGPNRSRSSSVNSSIIVSPASEKQTQDFGTRCVPLMGTNYPKKWLIYWVRAWGQADLLTTETFVDDRTRSGLDHHHFFV